MRPRLKIALAFTAGLAVGAAVWGSFQARTIGKFFTQREWIGPNQDALYLQLLASEKGTQHLRERLLSTLPQHAQRLNVHRDDLDFAAALWSVRLAYSMNERPVPAELEAILANLPAEAAPRCNGTRRILGLPPLEVPGTTPAAPAPQI